MMGNKYAGGSTYIFIYVYSTYSYSSQFLNCSQKFSKKLFEYGIYAVGFFYPVVPRNEARIRTQISASHNLNQLDNALEVFSKVKKELESN